MARSVVMPPATPAASPSPPAASPPRGDRPATLVVDCASSQLKAGLCTEPRPSYCFARTSAMDALGTEHLCRRYGADFADRAVVVAVGISTSRRMREELCRLAFDVLGAGAVYVGSVAFLAVLGAGLSTALVVDVGDAGFVTVPVEDGYPAPSCAVEGPLGGALLAQRLREEVLPTGSDSRAAKDQLADFAEDFAEDLRCANTSGADAAARREHAWQGAPRSLLRRAAARAGAAAGACGGSHRCAATARRRQRAREAA
eukprot:NODE_18494_length_890_cov_1.465269.p1 GENE.NODE_18494_length_890_cov_1.465269~~NODE_18494_length_890_cov_1.465269.p1  ORF type:complete len:258 (+),score=60.42 NODE_18494_length_890_cov_1.465269:72-845(+)